MLLENILKYNKGQMECLCEAFMPREFWDSYLYSPVSTKSCRPPFCSFALFLHSQYMYHSIVNLVHFSCMVFKNNKLTTECNVKSS